MKWIAAALLVVAACMDQTEAIPGDTSPDDPGAPPDETNTGKTDEMHKRVEYGGGVVMAAPTAIHVYWGSYWNTDAGVADRAVLDAFAGGAGTLSWWQVTAEYPDKQKHLPGAPTFGGSIVVDSDPIGRVKEPALHQFLVAQFHAGTLTYDRETVYFVFPAPGAKGPKNECGHHSYFTANIAHHKVKIIYALEPYLTDRDTTCGVGASANGVVLDEMTVTLSHEIAEAITDPYLDAWGKGSDNEVADQCETGFLATLGDQQFAVQDVWSNNQFACAH